MNENDLELLCLQWFRDSVGARLKILVRRTLQCWKYPPDKAPEAIELVMTQAEKLSNEWSL
jgi:type I restriction enzyme R subunit